MSTQDDLATSAWRAMRTLVLDLHDRRFAVSDAIGMTYLRAKALRLLLPGPLPMRDLGAVLTTDAPYTTVLVDDLEQRGLVRREVNPADRRSKLVHVTEAGRAVADQADRIQSTPPPTLAALDAQTLAALEQTLRALVQAP
jgi:DNA-binding MarR family transcriptional regulator